MTCRAISARPCHVVFCRVESSRVEQRVHALEIVARPECKRPLAPRHRHHERRAPIPSGLHRERLARVAVVVEGLHRDDRALLALFPS